MYLICILQTNSVMCLFTYLLMITWCLFAFKIDIQFCDGFFLSMGSTRAPTSWVPMWALILCKWAHISEWVSFWWIHKDWKYSEHLIQFVFQLGYPLSGVGLASSRTYAPIYFGALSPPPTPRITTYKTTNTRINKMQWASRHINKHPASTNSHFNK